MALGVDHANCLVLDEYWDGKGGRDRRLRLGCDDNWTRPRRHPRYDGAIVPDLGPRTLDRRNVTAFPDSPNRKPVAFVGEEQNPARAGRARNHSQQDRGQAIPGVRRRQRVHDLMRADGIDSS